MAKLSKRQKAYQEKLAPLAQPTSATTGITALLEAVNALSKYDEAVEAHIRLGIDMKKADQQIRTTVVLPEGTGKVVRVCVIAKGVKVKEAEDAGADFSGSDELIAKIQNENWLDFDVLVATPDVMAQLGKLGKVLGPKGLMPNPKTGTVTTDVATAVKNLKAGQVEIRPDKTSVVHVVIGRKAFTAERLLRNLAALYGVVERAKPSAVKGTYIKSVYLSASHGPSVKLDPTVITAELKSLDA
ncbi:MAG: 50S ribosomal protein L1 [Vampirovibrionales bacterium]